MKTTYYLFFLCSAVFLLFITAVDPVYAQEPQPSPKGEGSPLEGSSTNLRLVPSQERLPQADWNIINPEYIIPPIGSPPSSPVIRDPATFKAPLIRQLERGKWYVQIGAYARTAHVEDAIKRVETAGPVVIQNAGTDEAPMFRVLLGPFSQNESKTMLKSFKDKGYDAFLRSGN